MRKLLASLACLFLLCAPAYAQKTKAALTTEINTNWPDNTTGAITPALLRSTVLDIVNSYFDLNGGSSLNCPAHQWISSDPTLSSIGCSQPGFSDLSGSAAISQIATIASGTLLGNPTTSTASVGTITLGNMLAFAGTVMSVKMGSSSQLGVVACDGVTIICSGGTITAIGGAASSIGVGTTTIASGTNTFLLYDNSGVVGNESLASILVSPPPIGTTTPNVASFTDISLTPAATSYKQGFLITQSSPTSGSVVGPFNYNEIDITDESNVTGSAGTTQTSGLRVNLTVGGANLSGQPKIAGYFNTIESIAAVASATDKIGVVGGCLIQIVEASTGAGCYGLNSSALVQNNGSISRLVGAEVDIGVSSGSAATNRYAYSIVNTGVVQGSTLDSAIFLGNFGGTAGAWKGLVEFSNAFGFAPMATTANLFSSDTTFTINDVFHFGNAQINGNIWTSPNVTLVGNGSLTLGNSANSAGGNITLNGGTSGSFTLEASGTGLPTLTAVPGPAAGTDPLCYNTSSSLITWATACTASDERLKTNFSPAPGLRAALCMSGISFDWRDADQAKHDGRQIGLLAQEVEKCAPELISVSDMPTEYVTALGDHVTVNHPMSVNYGRITAILINAIKQIIALFCGTLLFVAFLIIVFYRKTSKRLLAIECSAIQNH